MGLNGILNDVVLVDDGTSIDAGVAVPVDEVVCAGVLEGVAKIVPVLVL